MWSTEREVAEGDLVIIWMTRDLVQPLLISAGKDLNNRFGVYRHSDLIGIPYGSKVGSRNGKGFVHVLRPTPELWTLALPHRTQILYLADIAFVTSWLDIKPGSKVIEAGTGSGSFSHSTARTIGPTGHLWSYEFHEARAKKAREEFSEHALDDIITLTHRNVCKEGFTVEDTVDAVFLDLPAPWEAIQHAKTALRKDRPTRICCFSPCMEQVLRTVSALNEAGFTDITMYETLLRPHQVESIPRPPPISVAADSLKRLEIRKEEKRLRQIASAHRGSAYKGKRKRNEEESAAAESSSGEAAAVTSTKRAKTDEIDNNNNDDTDAQMLSAEAPMPVIEPSASGSAPSAPAVPRVEKISVSKAFPEVRGHTSYLTFAVLFPPSMAGSASAAESADDQTPPPPSSA